MALSKSAKTALIGGGILAGVFAAIGAANASDGGTDDDGGGDDTPPQCGPGTVPQIQPDGTWKCVPIVVVDPVFPVEPPPPPPPQNVCNYSGCGPAFDNNNPTPVQIGIWLQQLGYPINPAAPGWSIITEASMTVVREFQRDYNAVRSSSGLAAPAALRGPQGAPAALASIKNGPQLATDGLVGKNTLGAITRARNLVPAINLSWEQCVNLSGG